MELEKIKEKREELVANYNSLVDKKVELDTHLISDFLFRRISK